jgi:hypothetical protein
MVHQLKGHFSEDEELLRTESLETVARRIVAELEVLEEEAISVESTRPTCAVFSGEPWR